MRAALLLLPALLACAEAAPPPETPRLGAEALAGRAARWTRFLADYVALDTTSPPGNEARAFPLLSAALLELGLSSTVSRFGEERGNLWARLTAEHPDPGARPLVLLHHIDVVPPERERWSVPPFSATLRDGRMYGRGTLDIKGLGAVQLAALETVARQRARLRRDVILLAVSDEEVEGEGAQRVVREQLAGWQPEYLLDEGGFSVRSFLNARDLVVIATAQKRVTRLKLVARGEAGHGSRPIPGGGPNVLVEALARLLAQPREVRLGPTTRVQFARLGQAAGFPKSFLLAHLEWPLVLWGLEGSLSANKNLNPSLRDTLALTMLHAGQKDNVIPAEASAVLDVRLLPDTEEEELLGWVRRMLEGLPVEATLTMPLLPAAPESPTADPLYQALEQAVRAHEREAIVSPWLLVGASDSRFFAPAGVKTYGFVPVFVSKEQIDTIHGHDENVTVAELEKGMTIYAEALQRFLLRDP